MFLYIPLHFYVHVPKFYKLFLSLQLKKLSVKSYKIFELVILLENEFSKHVLCGKFSKKFNIGDVDLLSILLLKLMYNLMHIDLKILLNIILEIKQIKLYSVIYQIDMLN